VRKFAILQRVSLSYSKPTASRSKRSLYLSSRIFKQVSLARRETMQKLLLSNQLRICSNYASHDSIISIRFNMFCKVLFTLFYVCFLPQALNRNFHESRINRLCRELNFTKHDSQRVHATMRAYLFDFTFISAITRNAVL